MKRLDLRQRVTLASVAALTIALAIASVAGNLLLSKRLDSDADNALRNRAAAQLVTLDSKDGKLHVSESNNDAVLDEQSWVFDGNTAIEQPRASQMLQDAAYSLRAVGAPAFRTVDERVRLYATPALADNGTDRIGTVIVGISLRPYENIERFARAGTLLLDFFVLLAAAFTVYWAVGRALRPVQDMTERAADWSEHDLHRRFELGEPFDEITGLAATLDGLLARIDAAMRREQRLTAEIAHELRTPLSGVRAEAELAMRDADGERAAALQRIIAGTDRMNSAITTLLATHLGEQNQNRWCDPFETVIEIASSARAAAAEAGVEIVVNPSTQARRVETDRQVLAQTLAPLVENAVRHAEQRATISVRHAGGKTIIRVEDDGAGIAPEASAAMFEPGVSHNGGAGLGLPLARRLAHSFGAEITAEPSAQGGAFELLVPDQPAGQQRD